MPNPHSQLWRWEVAQMLGAGASDTPPANPSANQLWWESDTGSLFIWYVDPDSAQWVQVSDGRPSLYDPFMFGTADMSLRSGAAGAVNVNSKADGTGSNVLTLSAAGGIVFPSTAIDNPSPNALDDYEEGTWTPVLAASSGSITSYTASGTYTKIGRMVFIHMDATLTNNGTGTGAINVSGLPFTPTENASGGGREVAVVGYWASATLSSGSGTMSLLKYDNTYPGATNHQLRINVSYKA
jgi:hypothetical protein